MKFVSLLALFFVPMLASAQCVACRGPSPTAVPKTIVYVQVKASCSTAATCGGRQGLFANARARKADRRATVFLVAPEQPAVAAPPAVKAPPAK